MSSRPVNQEPFEPIDPLDDNAMGPQVQRPKPVTDIDLIIADLKDLCSYGNWDFKIRSAYLDSSFILEASCGHGLVVTRSETDTDLSTAFIELYNIAESNPHHQKDPYII